MTYEKLLARQKKAINFVRNVKQDEDWASELESESPEDYAARKRITITNPEKATKGTNMAEMTKAEMQEYIEELEGKLDSIGEILADGEGSADDADDSQEDDPEED